MALVHEYLNDDSCTRRRYSALWMNIKTFFISNCPNQNVKFTVKCNLYGAADGWLWHTHTRTYTHTPGCFSKSLIGQILGSQELKYCEDFFIELVRGTTKQASSCMSLHHLYSPWPLLLPLHSELERRNTTSLVLAFYAFFPLNVKFSSTLHSPHSVKS